jgi:hypothetical protein
MVAIKGQPWTLKDLENHLETLVRECYYIAKDNGKNPLPDRHSCSRLSDTVYLRDKEHGSLAGFGVDQSHSLGNLASGITPGKKPSSHGSSAICQRIVDPCVFPDPLGVDGGCPPHATDL